MLYLHENSIHVLPICISMSTCRPCCDGLAKKYDSRHCRKIVPTQPTLTYWYEKGFIC